MKIYTYNTKKLDYELVNLQSKIWILGIILAIMISFSWSLAPKPILTNLTQEEKLIVLREYNGFSEQKLIQQIKELNFRYPYIILAQAYQETNHFKSDIFLHNNNLFGMKEAKSRSTLANGTNRGHAFYKDWKYSIIDYALYYSTYLYDIKTEGEYYSYLQQYYAEDPTYVERLKKLIKQNNLKQKFHE